MFNKHGLELIDSDDDKCDYWYKNWAKLYPSVNDKLHLSYSEFWETEPCEIEELMMEWGALEIEKTNERLAMNWHEAALIATGINNPKQFPKKPSHITSKKEKEEKAADVIKLAMSLKAMRGSNNKK